MSYDIVTERVPRFSKRVGDRVIEGSNNSIIILGTDRVDDLASGYGHINADGEGKNAGSMHLIVGRSEENPNVESDKSFLFMSMRTDVDKNMNTKQEFETNDTSATVIKSNSVRVISRQDLKIISGDSYVTLKSDGSIVVKGSKIVLEGKVELGRDATERLLKGDMFKGLYEGHVHPTAVGMSGTPVPLPDSVLSSDKLVK